MNRSRAPRILVALVAASTALLGTMSPVAGGSSATSTDGLTSFTAEAIAARAEFGWPTDAKTIGNLAAGADVGLAEWGLPMTRAEETDLLARMAFENELGRGALPYVDALPTSGGAWFDAAHGGKLIVMLTTGDQAVRDEIASRMPAISRGIEFRTVEFTQDDLVKAAHRAAEVWKASGTDSTLLGVTVDVRNNRLVLRFTSDELSNASRAVPAMTDALGVPVATAADEPDVDTGCGSRGNCWDPILKAGVYIYEHGVPSPIGNICTMGFHMELAGDQEFVTAGHCGIYNTTYVDWWHSSASGRIGNEIENLINSDGFDIMRINLPDARASNQVYGETKVVFGWTWPTTGQAAKVSLGWGSNTIKTGTITDAYVSWTSNTCGCTVWGADASWTTVGGDSGSPVYSVDGSYLNALGTNSNVSGKLAKLGDMFVYGAGGGIYVP
jgi:hypothetical protein